MTYSEFEKWLFNDEPRGSDEQIKFDLPEYNFAWWAWQARGELDAVRIKELEADLDDRKREVNLRCVQIQERDIRIAELTAKWDKAKEALGKILVGYADKNNVEAISTKALQELDK